MNNQIFVFSDTVPGTLLEYFRYIKFKARPAMMRFMSQLENEELHLCGTWRNIE